MRSLLYEGHPGHGAFVDSCFRHSMSCSAEEDLWAGLHVLSSVEHYTLATAVQLWLADTAGLTSMPAAAAATAPTAAAATAAAARDYPHASAQSYTSQLSPQTAAAVDGSSTLSATVTADSPPNKNRLMHFYLQNEVYPCNSCCTCKPIVFN